MDKQIDFLAIGDIATEPFIKIKDAEETCDIHGEHCKICFRFGEKIPYESAEVCNAVGNSPNVAVGISRLGISSHLVSYIGDDDIGKQNIETLIKEGVNVDFMKIVSGMDSNYHFVLWYQNERTILVKHTEFPYSLPGDLPPAKWVYLSSLAPNSLEYHKEILEYLKNNPETKLALQPGTFQIKFGVEALKDIYKHTEILFCNVNEAKRILQTEEDDKPTLMSGLLSLGPKIVIMTDGVRGAYAHDGSNAWFVPSYTGGSSYESTGAGDSFAAAVVAALILGKDLEEALSWGPVNAMSVVSFVGAQKGLLSREKLEEHLSNAPENYKVVKLN